jgi:ubiquinone biosynthesis protein Coq4
MITEDVSSLSQFERYRRAFTALARVIADPTRTDEVLDFSTYINATSRAAGDRLDFFYADPDGQRLYAEGRAIDSRLDLDALAALPAGTLGHAYARFLRDRGLTPDVFDGRPDGVRDDRAAYVIQRLRQTHDLWHVVTGYDTDAASEVALQAFSYAQLRAPSSFFLAAAGTARGMRDKPSLPRESLAGYRAGARAGKLATFPWEDHWATPLAEVRRMLAIVPVTYAAARVAA